MNEPENFLTRWSRRKQEIEQQRQETIAPDEQREDAAAPDRPSSSVPHAEPAPGKSEAELDLTTLPLIDSIGAGTDVRAFLQKGVPLDLTRAALRRAWTSDPTIRDFIEVAENQWDFATGSDIPGFGPLEPSEELRRMVEAMFEPPASKASLPGELRDQDAEKTLISEARLQDTSPQEDANSAPTPMQTENEESGTDQNEKNIAMQQDSELLPTRHRHGGALPE